MAILEELTLEIHIDHKWTVAGTISCQNPQLGYRGYSTLAYDEQYVDKHLLKSDASALSCRFPVSYEFHRLECWPAFILDILPSGAGRRFWLSKLGLPNGPNADWPLLSVGSGNSPGNIRITKNEMNAEGPTLSHPGFERSAILERNEDFIEYALETGAPITGSSGAQGDAPKFLLTQDKQGKWHADGALLDEKASKHWIVKFPRGKHESDKKILRNEASYMHLALLLGLNVKELPIFEEDALFVPRFDRIINIKGNTQTVERLGLESLCSASGISEFGYIFKLEDLCKTIFSYSTNALEDILEFIFRDILNLICGNTDNHARNTSLIKNLDGSIRLSPLYDFAPMYIDREGIARLNRWKCFESSGALDLKRIIEWLVSEFSFDRNLVETRFTEFKHKLTSISDFLKDTGIDEDIQKRILLSYKSLKNVW